MISKEKSGAGGSRHYEFIEHTADIAIKAYGSTVEEAYAVAADAMFDIVTDGSVINPDEKVEIEVESVDREGLLVGLLSRLIVLHEVDGWVLTDFEVALQGQDRLSARGWGEKFDKNRHSYGHHVKGVSYHMMEISESTGEGPAHVQVLFDV